MPAYTSSGVSTPRLRVATQRYRLAAAFLLAGGLLGGTGCGAGAPSNEQLKAFLTAEHKEVDELLATESLEVAKTEVAGDPPKATLHFKTVEKLKLDLFKPATVEEAFAFYKFDPAALKEAESRVGRLREPERARTAAARPKSAAAGKYFALALPAGTTLNWEGTAVAEHGAEGWKFVSRDGRIAGDKIERSFVGADQMPAGAIVLSESGENALTRHIKEARAFLDSVAAAEKAVAERLEGEAAALREASAAGRTYSISVPQSAGAPVKLQMAFLPAIKDGPPFAVLITEEKNDVQRSVWTGDLTLPPAPDERGFGARPAPDGWTLGLRPAIAGDSFPPQNRGEIRLVPTPDGLVWSATKPLPLVPSEKAAAWPSFDEAKQAVEVATAPGQAWQGTLQYPGEPTQAVRFTFTERRDGGQYSRACFEALDGASKAAAFEGVCQTDLPGVYGWPIQLKRVASSAARTDKPRLLALLYIEKTVTLGLDEQGQLIGRDSDGGVLRLKPVERADDYAPRVEQWTAALAPGKIWSGVLGYGNDPPAKVRLTVAETRDDQRYVRALLECETDPQRFAVYEGALDRQDGAIDGYSLSLVRKVGSPTRFGRSSTGNEAFGIAGDGAVLFRLSPDGKRLIGVSDAGEVAELTAAPSDAAIPLDVASMAALWREKFAKDSKWRGVLSNPGANQKVEIELVVASAVDELGNVSATIAIPKQSKSRVNFVGTLRSEDLDVNGFAVKLNKETLGQGGSAVFGAGQAMLHFRLSADATKLIGMAGDGNGWAEFLELSPAETAAKPAP